MATLPELTQRADQQILALGLAPTRSAAQRLVEQGAIQWHGPKGWTLVRKAGEALPIGADFKVLDDAETRWVSRAGLKLEGALKHCAACKHPVDLSGKTCLDVGQSTGGFTEVMLSLGAERVVGIDVGHGQVHHSIAGHPQVTVIEGVNARHLTAEDLGDAAPQGGFDFIVGDLSFISLTLVLPSLVPFMAPKGELMLLVKPQFELQPEQIGRGGLVKDPESYPVVEARIKQACTENGLKVRAYFNSPITGRDGNREFFVRTERA